MPQQGSVVPTDEARGHVIPFARADQGELSCQLCGTQPLERFESCERVVLWHCPRCGLYQYGRLFACDQYHAEYHNIIYIDRLRHKVSTAGIRLSRVASVLESSRPRLLEVGCSLGSTIEAALERGWDAVGVDVSREAVQFCCARDLNCLAVDGRVLPFEDASFDVLVSWHVIEHVADVKESLTEWRRVIRPNGVMVLETPDASCPKVRRRGRSYGKFWKPEHTYTFTPETLQVFVEQAGFEVLRAPLLGRIQDLPLSQACYAIGHRLLDGLMYAAGQRKAFQIFARRAEDVPSSLPFPLWRARQQVREAVEPQPIPDAVSGPPKKRRVA